MTADDDLYERFEQLQQRLEGQLKRKDYELALVTTEDLIELCSNVEEFDIGTWLSYYSQIKEHMFTSTIDKKKEIIRGMIENQEMVRLSNFQSQMQLTYIDDFEFVIQSLPESEIYRILDNRIEFTRPQNSSIEESVDTFLSNLHMVIQ